jgi:DNA-binding NtrC family response regulator
MGAGGVKVLLVGNAARKASILDDYLLKRGCDLCFASSQKDALELLRRRRFDLVLSEFMLSDGTAYQLMPLLRGTDTTMFFSNAVEDGCWWMKAIYEGEDHSEDPGMRPGQFRLLLDEILFDRLLRNANERRCKQREDRSGGLGIQVRKE